MSVSIIIPHNPKRDRYYLDRCLASIQQSNYEIIVADKGNKSESRNNAVLYAKGEIVIFLDDDVVVRKNCFEELLAPFSNRSVGIVGGVNIAFSNIEFREHVGAVLWSSPLAMMRSVARYTPRGDIRETDEAEIISCVMAVRKKAFLEAGGYPLEIIPCEENVLVNNIQKLGYKVIYNPFAIVYHRRPRIFMEYWRTIFDYGRGRGIMMRRHSGNPKMLWKPNRKWIYYSIALLGHYVSYILGLVMGYLS